MNWRDLKYRIADRFFEYELDEAYRLGMKQGRGTLAADLRVRMQWRRDRNTELGMTKTQSIGWDKCMDEVRDAIK